MARGSAMTTRRSRFTTTLLLLAVVAVVAAILEGGGRFLTRGREQNLMISPHLNWSDVQRFHPDLMWALKPNLDGVVQRVRTPEGTLDSSIETNALGLRNSPIGPKGDRLRILALGDSTTFGAGVNGDETWPAQLQKALDPEDAGLVEVINAGVSGYSAFQGLRYLELYGFDLVPDMVITCFGHNEWSDVLPTQIGDVEWTNSESASGFVLLIEDAIRGAARMIRPKPFGERHQRMTPGEFADTLVRMDDLCRLHGCTLVHLVWPYLSDLRKQPRGDQAGPRALIIGASMYNGTPTISLFDLVAEHSEALFFDEVHMTAEGCRLVADYVAARLGPPVTESLWGQTAERMVRWGEVFERRGDLSSAAGAYRQALQYDAENLPALVHLAEILNEQGDEQALVSVLAKLRELDPEGAYAEIEAHRSPPEG